MERKVSVALLFIGLIVGLASTAAAQNAAAGKDLFAAKCAICHGADGAAKTGMGKTFKIRDFHLPEVQKQTDAELSNIILKGKGKMPAQADKLSGTELADVLAYIRELGKKKP
jgi:mono/diheme cytochrome c family protein